MTGRLDDRMSDMIREAGLEWLLTSWFPPQEAEGAVRDHLDALYKCCEARLPNVKPRLSDETLLAEYQRNPQRVEAFLQALGETSTPHMLLMVWRILQGADVQALEMKYTSERQFHLRVELKHPASTEPEVYESDDIDDAALLRHLGIMKMDGRPLFDGFYPLSTGA